MESIEFVYPGLISRGIIRKTDSGTEFIGTKSDLSRISKYQFCNGTLTFYFKEGGIDTQQDFYMPMDAILNKLDTCFFRYNREIYGLVNGSSRNFRPIYFSGDLTYHREHFDDDNKQPIDFFQVSDFVFDNSSFSHNREKFSISMRKKFPESFTSVVDNVLGHVFDNVAK